jgi:hypothetical protein
MGKRLVTDKISTIGNTHKISVLQVPGVTPHVTVCDAPRHTFGKKRVLVTVDAETGEEVGRYVDDGRAMPDRGDWLRIYQGYALQVASGPDMLTQVEAKALWLVIAKAGFGNLARVNVSAASRDWQVSRESVSRALSSLVAKRMIERTTEGGAYRLNPNFAWKGQTDSRGSHIKQWDRRNEVEPGARVIRQAGGCENG